MPGIFGIIDPSLREEGRRQEAVDLVSRMADAMRYEPSYVVRVICGPGLAVCVGRVGLPCQDGVIAADEDATTIVISAGEPVCDDVRVDRGSDRAVSCGTGARELLRVYRTLGIDGLRRVSGPFSGFVGDARTSECALFTDPYGCERVFIYSEAGRTVFSSEAKAILAVAPQARAFDTAGVAQWLGCGGTLGERSLFHGVEVLPAGTAVIFRQSGVTRRKYIGPSDLEQLTEMTGDQFMREFPACLTGSVKDAVSRGPRAGISLTGGLDSRMIMACLDRDTGSIPSYTFGSMYRDTFDVSIARTVAASCGCSHDVLELGQGFLTELPTTLGQAVYIADGYLGLSGAAELYLNRKARGIAPARVTGNWGGELLRGVRAFKFVAPAGGVLHADLVHHIRQAEDAFEQAGQSYSHPLSYTLFHQMPTAGYGRSAIERSQVVMRSPFLTDRVVRCLYQAPPSVRQTSATSVKVVGLRPDLLAIQTDTGVLGTGVAPVRTARRLWSRAMSKGEYLTSHGAPHWMASVITSGAGQRLERLFAGRNKFQHFQRWLRADLATFVRDTLGDASANGAGIFDSNRAAHMVDRHIAGRNNYTEEIDKMMTVTLIGQGLLRGWPVRPRPLSPSELMVVPAGRVHA